MSCLGCHRHCYLITIPAIDTIHPPSDLTTQWAYVLDIDMLLPAIQIAIPQSGFDLNDNPKVKICVGRVLSKRYALHASSNHHIILGCRIATVSCSTLMNVTRNGYSGPSHL